MTSSTAQKDPPGSYIRFDGWLGAVENAFNLVAAASILALMLLAVAQVIGRSAFNWPVPGFIDITEQAMAVFASLGGALAVVAGLFGSLRFDTPSGPSIVGAALLLFLLSLLPYPWSRATGNPTS